MADGGGNYFKSDSELNITGNGTITINTADTTQGLAIIGSGSNTTSLDIGTIDLKQGKLLVSTNSSNSGNVSAAADIVTVGTATTAAQKHTALLTLRANGENKTVTFGNKGSEITVNGDGRLDLEATSGSITISGAALTLNNGAFMLTTNKNGSATTTSGTISVDTYTINSGASHVISGSGGKYVTEIFDGQTANFAGNLLIASGNAWQLEPTIPDDETERVSGAGFVTLADGSNTVVGGTLTVNSGTLTVAEGAKLHASGDDGVIKVLDTLLTDATDSVLTISSDNLTRFLIGEDSAGSGSTYTEIKADGTLGEPNKATGASGAIVLSGGRLELTDTTPIELNKFNFKAINDTNGTKGVISFNSGSANTIYAQDLVLKAQLKSGGTDISADKNLWLESQTLTLGDSSKQDTTGKDYGFSGATTQNLVLQNSGAAFILENAVTLDVTVDGDTVVAGESGTIEGDLIISDSLTARRGTFSSTDDITISGGTLSVTNGGAFGTGDAAQTIDTILKLEGDLTLKAGAASKIEVDGSNQGEHATILDIQDVNSFKVVSGTSPAAEVNVKSGGTLVAKGEHLKTLLNDVTAGQSGAKVFLDQGTISIVDDLTIDSATTKLVSGASAANDRVLTFSSTNGGTLEVDGTLTLNGVSGLDLGTSGTIVAHALTLNNEDQAATDDTATLKSGKYLAQTALRSHDTSDTINISGAKVFLGDFNEIKVEDDDSYYEALSESGTIDSKVVLSDTGSELTVQAGAWKGSSITVNTGTLHVGLDSTVSGFNGLKHDSNGDVIGASLNLDTLEVGTNGKTAVAEGSTLDTTNLKVTATATDAFTVAGTADISGKYTAAVTQGQTPTPASYGVTLTGGAGSIKVTQGGVLSFGAEATKAITLDPASDDADKDAIAVAADTFGDKIFSVAAGGTIAFSFSSGDVFSAEALTDMRSKLFDDVGTDGLIAGTINLGDARLAGVNADSDGAYNWDDLHGYSDVADFTTDDIKRSVVKGIEAGDNIRGHFGALRADSINAGGQITIVGDTSLNNAAAVSGGKFAVGNGGAILGLNVTKAALVKLNGGGAIGAVNLADGATLSINHDQSITAPSKTTIESISGGTAQFGVGESEVTGRTEVNNLINNAGTVTFKDRVTVGDASSSSDAETLLGGVATTFEQDATFYNDTEIAGGMTTFQDGVTFNKWAGIYGDTTVSGGAVLSSGAEIGGASTLTADSVELADTTGPDIRFSVGEEDYVENGQTHSGSTGYLQTASMVLNGNILIVDPSYDHATSIAAIEDFDDVVNNDEDAGTFSGTIFVGQNAALGVGQDITVADVAEFIKQYQNSQGALIQDQVGSVLYLDGMLTAADGSQLILDSQHTQAQVFDGTSTASALINDRSTYWGKFGTETTARKADLYLGQNTIMAVSDNILSQGAAIHFDKTDAAIMAQSVKDSSDAAKIVLDGNGFLDSRQVTLFTDKGNGTGNETVLRKNSWQEPTFALLWCY